jgi:putative oxidoreductase
MLKQLWSDLPKSHAQLGSLLLRVGLGAIFMFHGYLKLSVNGGSMWSDVLPEGTQVAVAWGELICGAALALGLLSRLAAIGLTVVMVGAIILQTGRFGFVHLEYLKVGPARAPTGAEYNVALIVMCLAVLALGSGQVSLDYLIYRVSRRQPRALAEAAARSAESPGPLSPVGSGAVGSSALR